MEIESSIVASQNALIINPAQRQPEREAEARAQQQQRQQTELPVTQTVSRQANAEAFEQAERFRQQRRSNYDAPNPQTQAALNTYQSLQTEQRREEIRGLLGIDIYA
ncbi:hypothetical protein QTP81_06735 [Alteromonas sp. ASW11-36]|uniref:Uncharacterized protein n=1 Tax=Alteromonas arenosi TaxID=3055817 RepID=A0ABT7SVT0_9ALTE|nr:hypothetical protein [Alteromonas sp. ASW11-36]MDM7860286.1 hypothetical protein [Alteromonas sp. ASW11-36]